jgi:hypothetical protein
MRTSLDIPDDLFRRTKSVASKAGISLREFVVAALRERLKQSDTSWRDVFGKVNIKHLNGLDSLVAKEFSRIDLTDWN